MAALGPQDGAASAVRLPCWGTAWTSCSFCPTASESSSKSTDPTTTRRPTGHARTRPVTPTWPSADRELKFSGYEVFRFGATELKDLRSARDLLQAFFTDLFRRFSVTP